MSVARWSSGLGTALALVVAAAILMLAIFAPGESSEPNSSTSTRDDGRLAALLLLRSFGFDSRSWNAPLGELNERDAVLWLARSPGELEVPEHDSAAAGAADRSARSASGDPWDLAARRGVRSVVHYADFVERGGTLIAGADLETLAFLRGDPRFRVLRDVERGAAIEGSVRVAFEGDRHAELEATDVCALSAPRTLDDFESLWTDASGRCLALAIRVGSGRCVILGTRAFVENRPIRNAQNAYLFVSLCAELAKSKRVYFDDFAAGGKYAQSLAEILVSPSVRIATLNAILLAASILWGIAWVKQFPRDASNLRSRSAASRVAAQASLFVRARRFEVLADWLRAGTAQRAAARLRVARTTGTVELEHVLRFAERRGLEPTRAAALQKRLDSTRVTNANELVAFDRACRECELELAALDSHRTSSPA